MCACCTHVHVAMTGLRDKHNDEHVPNIAACCCVCFTHRVAMYVWGLRHVYQVTKWDDIIITSYFTTLCISHTGYTVLCGLV